MEFLPLQIRVAFSGDSQLRQSRATKPTVYIPGFSVFSKYSSKLWQGLLSSLCSVVAPLLWRKLLSKPPASSIFFCLSSVIHFSSYVCVWILCLLGNQKLLSPLCESEMTKLWYLFHCAGFQCIIFFKWMHFPDKMEIDSQWLSSLNILPFCVLQSEFILV